MNEITSYAGSLIKKILIGGVDGGGLLGKILGIGGGGKNGIVGGLLSKIPFIGKLLGGASVAAGAGVAGAVGAGVGVAGLAGAGVIQTKYFSVVYS